jgi:hypothetical protein
VQPARREYEEPPVNYPRHYQFHDPFQMISAIERELLGNFLGGHHIDPFSRMEGSMFDERDSFMGLSGLGGIRDDF